MRSNTPIADARRAHARGFTLIELMVGSVVSSIVVLGVLSAYAGINSAYLSETKIKSAVEHSRSAQAFLERTVRLAGYGVDPKYAFDFATTNLGSYGTTKDNYVPSTTPPTFATDDLAFRYRDPGYFRSGKLTTAGDKITFNTSLGVDVKAGQQSFIVACPNSGGEYVVVKSQGTGTVSASATSITTATYGAPFSTTVPTCATLNATVFLMYEIRIRVKEYGGLPYLVAFDSFETPDTAAFVPIAAGVESFQVAYVMNRPVGTTLPAGVTIPDTAGNSNWILMDVGSEPLPTTGDLAPNYDTSYSDKSRFNKNPTNIRAVRLSLVVRNNSAFANLKYPRGPVENQPVFDATPDGYFRTTITTTVPVPNMKSRAFFLGTTATGG
ncbi:MAG: PilW family protein [Myxococcales bacterium]